MKSHKIPLVVTEVKVDMGGCILSAMAMANIQGVDGPRQVASFSALFPIEFVKSIRPTELIEIQINFPEDEVISGNSSRDTEPADPEASV